MLETILMQIFNGLSLSSILLMIALGLSITFGIMGVINFAHGEFLMLGAYTAFIFQKIFYTWMGGFYFFFVIPFSFIFTAIFGMVLERTIIRFLYGKTYESILVTWGLSLILQQASRNIFGASNVDVVAPTWLSKGIVITESVQLPYNRLFIIAISIVSVIAMYYFINRTANGRRMRAVMQNRSMGACMGINTKKVDMTTFAIGCGLAGVAGTIVSLLGSIGPSTGQNYIVDAFMVVVLGGVGNLAGTIAGAIMMGLASPIFEFVTTSSMGKVIVFLLVIAYLQFKPSGMFTFKARSLD